MNVIICPYTWYIHHTSYQGAQRHHTAVWLQEGVTPKSWWPHGVVDHQRWHGNPVARTERNERKERKVSWHWAQWICWAKGLGFCSWWIDVTWFVEVRKFKPVSCTGLCGIEIIELIGKSELKAVLSEIINKSRISNDSSFPMFSLRLEVLTFCGMQLSYLAVCHWPVKTCRWLRLMQQQHLGYTMAESAPVARPVSKLWVGLTENSDIQSWHIYMVKTSLMFRSNTKTWPVSLGCSIRVIFSKRIQWLKVPTVLSNWTAGMYFSSCQTKVLTQIWVDTSYFNAFSACLTTHMIFTGLHVFYTSKMAVEFAAGDRDAVQSTRTIAWFESIVLSCQDERGIVKEVVVWSSKIFWIIHCKHICTGSSLGLEVPKASLNSFELLKHFLFWCLTCSF